MWIQFFDFKMRYVLETKYIIINRLSQKFKIKKKHKNEKNINNFINFQLNIVRILILKSISSLKALLEFEYTSKY